MPVHEGSNEKSHGRFGAASFFVYGISTKIDFLSQKKTGGQADRPAGRWQHESRSCGTYPVVLELDLLLNVILGPFNLTQALIILLAEGLDLS